MADLAQAIRSEFLRPFWRATAASSSGAQKTMRAILAALDLHKPTGDRSGWVATGEYGNLDAACQECGSQDLAVRWPCPTLLAIASALEVGEGT